MSAAAIEVENLAKRYRLGEREPYRVLRESLTRGISAGLRRKRSVPSDASPGSGDQDWLWALDDVSLQIPSGELCGLIGRNGSGKSTLLKILSRITRPSRGRAVVLGRVGSLLEVGTGFHPELTGRENVFLNGAMLGMDRAEIKRKLDDIVSFAEVERFVDTPVKRYSSGMYVRLAFSVAAHLEPEILLVDEVLAVGDAAFQRKCLGKMSDVAREGRTILFVSHDMTNVSVLCRSAILLRDGHVQRTGPTREVIEFYLSQGSRQSASTSWDEETAPGDDVARLSRVGVGGLNGGDIETHPLSDAIVLSMDWNVIRSGRRLNPVFVVRNALGTLVFSSSNYEDPEWGERHYESGRYSCRCTVPPHLLNDGTYSVDAMLVDEGRLVRARAEEAVTFSVFDDGSSRGGYVGPWDGVVRPRCDWEVHRQ